MAGITFIFIVLLQIIVSITWKAADAKGTERPRNPALFGDDNIGQAGDGHKPIPGISNGHLRDPAFFGGDMGRPARNKPIVGKGTERPRNPALFGDDNIGQAGNGHKPIPGISNSQFSDPNYFGYDIGRPAGNKPIVGKGTERPRNPALFGDDNIGQAGDGHKPIPGISNGHLRDPAFFGGDMGRPARNKPIVGKGTGRPRNPALFGDDNIGQAGNGHKPIPGISNYQFSDPNYFGYDIGRPAGNKPIVGKGTERPRNPALFGDDNIGQAGNGHKPIPGISNGQVSDPTLFGYDIARTGNGNVPFPGIGSESPRNPALSEDDNIGEYDDIE